jgi:hypothetical protein
VPDAVAPSVEDQAVSKFFEKYVMYPCNDGSSPGFLEHLPVLFSEVKIQGRLALRWAVRAASYANLSNEQNSAGLGNKALQCYGLALSALAEALADTRVPPDDYTLMTVVVLDLFEVGLYRPMLPTQANFWGGFRPLSRRYLCTTLHLVAPMLKEWLRFYACVALIRYMELGVGVYSGSRTIAL